MLNHVSSMADIRHSNNYRKRKAWTTMKETTRRIQSWGRNRSFIGLTSRPEEEEEEEAILRNLPLDIL